MATISANIEDGILTITTAGFPAIVVDPDHFSQSIKDYGFLHGMKQRIVDAAALGATATISEKYAAMQSLFAHMGATGEWRRTGQGDGTPGDGLLVRAIAEFNKCDLAESRHLVGLMDKKLQASMRGAAELKVIIARMKTEKARPTVAVDVTAILGSLRAM